MSAPYPNHNNHIYHGTPTDSRPRGQPAITTAHLPATSSLAPHEVLELASIDTRAPPGPVTDVHSRGVHGQACVTPGQYLLHNNTHAAWSGPGNAAGGSQQPQAANGARMDTRAYAPPPLAAPNRNVRMNQGPSTRGAVTTLPPGHDTAPARASTVPRPPLYEHEAYLKHFYDTRSNTPTYDELLQLAKKLGDSMYNIDAWFTDQRLRQSEAEEPVGNHKRFSPDAIQRLEGYLDKHGPWTPAAEECHRLAQELGIGSKFVYDCNRQAYSRMFRPKLYYYYCSQVS
ncbi:hypothetical protein K466DRAFT_563434 [Polyporus arcularius HHB13444]|uniref:Homeobox domain-containing protein n=1 Tax=Polyporus arcularius HHB13444 TaxID=1314778 RepID=A0A5C3PM55_9APHY|nr:hypothetical protein K466DRAFT_563434 [Polyporus arcularius HHB13444]